jgi:hypothetical protein
VMDLAGSVRTMKLVSLTQLDTGADIAEVDEDGASVICPWCGEPLQGVDGCACGTPEPGDAPAKLVRQGTVDLTTIDLLANDDTLWLETPKGVPFISLMENGEIVFVWPLDGKRAGPGDNTKWAIGQINTKTGVGGWVTASGRYISHEGPDYTDLPTAIEGAEVWIVETDQSLPSRNASWRRNQPASEKQMNLAKGLKIVGYRDMTKARLSDEISIRFAANRLDAGIK